MSLGFTGRVAVLAGAAVVALTGCGAGSAKPGTVGADLAAGNAAQQRGDLAAAEASYRAVLGHDPTNRVALYDLGLIAQTRGQLELARNDYLAAVAVSPDYEPALYNLGTVLGRLGQPAGAENYYRKAIAVLPGDANAHYNLGLLLTQRGDRSGGAAEIATARRLDPNLPVPPASAKATPAPAGRLGR